MKIYFLFIFFFIFLYTFSQKPRDTIWQLQREKEAEQRDLKKCAELKNDFKDVSFRNLGQMIADEIIFKINKKNQIVLQILFFYIFDIRLYGKNLRI